MESNWRLNAIWNGEGNLVCDMAAHLLFPISGRDWLCRLEGGGITQLVVALWDNTLGFVFPAFESFVPATGFPYGYLVDQSRLMP